MATIDAEFQGAQGAVGVAWKPTGGCTDVTRAESARACEPVQRLRQARGEAVRRDAMDREIVELERKAHCLGLGGVGSPELSERDVQPARILGLTTILARAGLLIGFAMLVQRRR